VIIAGVQHDIVWEDRDANFAHLDGLIGDAARQRARLIVLTEMFSTGFSMDTERIAEPFDGPSAQFLLEQATRRGVWICGSAPEVQPGDTMPSNTLILAAPDGAVTRYRKIHPFSHGGEHEKYSAGTERVQVDVEGVRCCLFVCYDLRFADEFWAVAGDTDCYVVVANWPAARREHWRTLLQARAIENQAFVVGVNRVGSGGGLDYSGDSAIVLPFGRRLEASERGGEEILLHDVTADEVAETRARWPFLLDRRDQEGGGGAS
jgi:predicted amidohydrolase